MDLLTISDNVAIPSPYVLKIEEFSKLVSRDKSKGKKDLFWVVLEPNQKQLEGKKFNHSIGAIGLPVENVEKIS